VTLLPASKRRRATDPRHRATTTDPELATAARSLAVFLNDVAHHHADDQGTVHLVAVGAPGQPAVLVVAGDVIAHAAQLLRDLPPRTAA
jgi:hypothetical protein